MGSGTSASTWAITSCTPTAVRAYSVWSPAICSRMLANPSQPSCSERKSPSYYHFPLSVAQDICETTARPAALYSQRRMSILPKAVTVLMRCAWPLSALLRWWGRPDPAGDREMRWYGKNRAVDRYQKMTTMTTITSDQVKALPAPKAQARRGVLANPWVALIRIALLGLLGWNSLQAEALTQFSIRSTDNPSLYGGVFDDGATFSGSFLVDLSQTLQPYLVLTSWDVWTSDSPVMDPGNPNMPIIPGQHYSSYAEGSSAWLATLYPMTNWLDFDEVAFFQGDSSLFFELVEPVGLFKGGLILGASEDYYPIDSFSNFARSREDWTGSAILIDPAIVDVTSAPEPGTGAPMIAALLLLAGVSVVWRRGKAPVQEVLLAFGGQATPPRLPS